jgi:hypothetical protein
MIYGKYLEFSHAHQYSYTYKEQAAQWHRSFLSWSCILQTKVRTVLGLQLKRASFHDALAMIQQVCLGDEVSAKNETLVPPTKQNGTE